jgi:hypothetical protein
MDNGRDGEMGFVHNVRTVVSDLRYFIGFIY